MSKTLTIDKEFSGLCPSLTDEELSFLESSIVADGCRDPIFVWANHDNAILDGHNRYEICTRLKIAFAVKALRFETREECVNWIIANQLGRRNLTDEQKSFLRGKQYQAEKTAGHGAKSGDQNDPQKTADRLAASHGVSAPTIKRDAAFADAVDKIEEVQGPEAKAAILSGKSNLGKAAVVKAAGLPPKDMAKAMKTGKLPDPKTPKSGQQKKDPRLWSEIEGLLGKAKNRVDDLNRQFPHGNLHRTLQGQLEQCIKTLHEWKRSVKT